MRPTIDLRLSGSPFRAYLGGLFLALVVAGVLAPLVAASPALLWGTAHVFLYSRFTGRHVLDDPARESLHRIVRTSPGVTMRQLSDECAISYSRVRHHLRILEQAGLVRTARKGRVRACFPVEHADKGRTALLDRTRRAIAAVLAASDDGLTQKDIAERAGVSRRLASHHLACLRRHGLVEASAGRPARHRATPALRELLETRLPDSIS